MFMKNWGITPRDQTLSVSITYQPVQYYKTQTSNPTPGICKPQKNHFLSFFRLHENSSPFRIVNSSIFSVVILIVGRQRALQWPKNPKKSKVFLIFPDSNPSSNHQNARLLLIVNVCALRCNKIVVKNVSFFIPDVLTYICISIDGG
jgi:hypothetical protein